LAYHYRNGLVYYFRNLINKEAAKQKRISDVRNFQVLENKGSKVVGIDVSEYQEKSMDSSLIEKTSYSVCFIRATGNG
jgi:lysozyme